MLIDVILPLFILMSLGYFLVLSKIISEEQIEALGTFVFKIGLPAFLLYAISTKQLSDIWQPTYLIAYGGGSLLLFIFTFLLCLYFYRYNKAESAVFAMGVSNSNTGFIGTGILTLLLQHQAAVYLSLTLIIENALIIPLTLLLAELSEQKVSLKEILLKIFKMLYSNTLIIAIVIGFILLILNIKLPSSVEYSLKLLGMTASPLALLVIGGRLVSIKMSHFNSHSIVFVLLKVLAMPMFICVLFLLLPQTHSEMFFAGVLLAALPMPISYSLIGLMYGIREKTLTPLMLSIFAGLAVVSIIIYFQHWFTI